MTAFSKNSTEFTYKSSNSNIATVNEYGTIVPVAAGNCDITVTTVANKSYSSGSAVLHLTVKAADNTKPVITFSHADGEYAYNTPMYFTVANTTSDYISFTVTGNNDEKVTIIDDGNCNYSFNLTYDAIITVDAMNDNGEASKTVEFTVKRPEAPVFSPAAGEVSEGSDVTFTSSTADVNKIVYSVIDTELDDFILIDEVANGNTGTYNVTKPVSILAKAYLPNGYASAESSADYTIKALPAPSAPVFSVPATDAVEEGSEVTVTAENAERIYVAEYFIDGELGEYAEYTAPLTVNKMHRRFVAYAENKVGRSETTEVFYGVKNTTSIGKVRIYKLVDDLKDIVDGGRYVVLAHATGTSDGNKFEVWNVMNSTIESSKNASWLGVTDASSYLTENENRLSGIPEGTQIIELEKAADDNTYYINAKDGDGNARYITPGDKKIVFEKHPITFSKGNNDDNAKTSTKMCVKMSYGSYNLQYNSSNPRFAGYSSTQKPVRLYRILEIPVSSTQTPGYSMAFHHTEYTGPVKGQKTTARRVAPVENPVKMTCTTASDGSLVYTCQPTKLCGNFGLTIEGQMLGGHADHVVTLSCPESCTETHEEYVCVPDGGSPIRLVREESENHRALSTNPNDYHNSLLLYHQPTVTVTAKPFERISLALDSRTGGTTGIEDIATDGAATAPVRLYNLNGVEIPAGVTPAPGLYLRRQGNTTAKVVIR